MDNLQQHILLQAAPWPHTDEDVPMNMQSTGYGAWEIGVDPLIQQADTAPWSAFKQYTSQEYQTYRGNTSLSDDGTAPELALAEPNGPQYRDDVSSFAGTGTEAAEAAQHRRGGLHFENVDHQNLGPALPLMPGPGSGADAASTYSAATATTQWTRASVPKRPYICTECKAQLHSKSKFDKHMQQHTRPYRCDYRDCLEKNSKGFGTANDLARHKITRHNEVTNGYYVCSHGDCGTATQPKLWPRKDNFRTHLAKVHSEHVSTDEADTKYFKAVPAEDTRGVASSTDTAALESLVTPETSLSETNTNHDDDEIPLMETDQGHFPSLQTTPSGFQSMSYLPSTYENSASSFSNMAPPISMSHVNGAESVQSFQEYQQQCNGAFPFTEVSGLSQSPGAHVQHVTTHQTSTSQAGSTLGESPHMHSQRASSIFSTSMPMGSLTVASSQHPGQTQAAPCHDTLVRQGLSELQIINHLSTFPTELLERALSAKMDNSSDGPAPEDGAKGKARFVCPRCGKACNRACELKKHMKRHERPYGCTVKNCYKHFGSKNDWKRHESNQHDPPVDAWACNDEGCIAIFTDRLDFVQHLMEVHDRRHMEDVQSTAQSCRIGRQCDARFWCGFCGQVVEIEEPLGQEDVTNGGYWSRRCDHIDSHLFGKGGLQQKSKGQWRFLEDEANRERPQQLDQMSTTETVWSATTSNGASYKRKGWEQTDLRPRKRADAQWAVSYRPL